MEKRFSVHNRAEVVLTGPAYFERLCAAIEGAQRSVHLQVYILADDATGARVWQALVRAARRGVMVHAMADGFASQDLPTAWVNELREAGGHFRWFEPLLRTSRFYIGRRMHHKVLVVDHRIALVSGRNIADRYTDSAEDPGWYDLGLAMEGEVALDLAARCCRVWNGSRTGHHHRAVGPGRQEREELVRTWPRDVRCALSVRFNDWLRGHRQVTRSYIRMLHDARQEAWLVSSYFVPGRILKRAIASAAGRGVRVRVIAAGPSDVPLAKPAERWLYAWLLRRGIEVYEYQHTVLHAKAGLFDGRRATIGSFNLNDLSTYTTLEVNVDVDDAAVGAALRTELERIAAHECVRVTPRDEARVPMLERLWRWTAYRILRLSYLLLTFYYRRG